MQFTYQQTGGAPDVSDCAIYMVFHYELRRNMSTLIMSVIHVRKTMPVIKITS